METINAPKCYGNYSDESFDCQICVFYANCINEKSELRKEKNTADRIDREKDFDIEKEERENEL